MPVLPAPDLPGQIVRSQPHCAVHQRLGADPDVSRLRQAHPQQRLNDDLDLIAALGVPVEDHRRRRDPPVAAPAPPLRGRAPRAHQARLVGQIDLADARHLKPDRLRGAGPFQRSRAEDGRQHRSPLVARKVGNGDGQPEKVPVGAATAALAVSPHALASPSKADIGEG
jgi:hypothetical protein